MAIMDIYRFLPEIIWYFVHKLFFSWLIDALAVLALGSELELSLTVFL